MAQRFHVSSFRPHYLITLRDLLRVLEGLLLLSPDTKAAQTQPQFGFLNRRGFQSSASSWKTPQKKTKARSARGRSLPGISTKKLLKRQQTKNPVDESEASTTLRMLIRLWCHESTRVYLDRVTDSKERMWFLKLLETCIKCCFCGARFGESLLKERGAVAMRRAAGPAGTGGHTAGLGKGNNSFL